MRLEIGIRKGRQKKKPDFKYYSMSISIISDLWPYVLEVFNDFRIQRCTSISIAPKIQIPGYIIVGYILNLTCRSTKHPTCRHTYAIEKVSNQTPQYIDSRATYP